MATIDYLITPLRLKIGDMDSTAYRYLDEWLITALIVSVKSLQRYWQNKYLITDKGVISRSTTSNMFISEESLGVVEDRDEDIIVLKAAIEVLRGNLENSAWSAVSWKDNEVSFSNLEQYRTRNDNLKMLIDELAGLVISPTKRLARPLKGSLPGYGVVGSTGYEKDTKF